jgi:hypothetical protein
VLIRKQEHAGHKDRKLNRKQEHAEHKDRKMIRKQEGTCRTQG